jgi:UDP-N-acetylglucosamine acyltransferase
MNNIHPTAIVHPGAQLGHGNEVGPFCVIGPNVTIGNNNKFVSHVAIGGPAQHRVLKNSTGPIFIGDNNHISEFVTIHTPTETITAIGHRCMIMACAHISHDTFIGDDVTIANNVLLGGHTNVMRNATIGLGAVIHQWHVIGAYSMIGMGAVITKKCMIECGKVYAGNPAKYIKDNVVGIYRSGITSDELTELEKLYEQILNRVP